MIPAIIIGSITLALYWIVRPDNPKQRPQPGFYHGWNGFSWDADKP